MNDFKGFLYEYRGAIIGAIVSLIVLFTGLLKLAIAIIIICAGIFLGNYVVNSCFCLGRDGSRDLISISLGKKHRGLHGQLLNSFH